MPGAEFRIQESEFRIQNREQRRRREELRRSFQPRRLRLLFVGESPPASGRFFYQGDSGLYRAMRDTFKIVDPSIRDEDFLITFQTLGCYLIDLCPDPVDRLDPKSRRAACCAEVESLSRTIVQLQPDRIATLLRSLEDDVLRAVSLANWNGPVIHLPYPGRWVRHRDSFADLLLPTIRSL